MDLRTTDTNRNIENKQIVSTAFTILIDNLQSYGNTLSMNQSRVLKALLETYTEIAFGNQQGRYAFGIPTGGGKSQSIVAFITALAKHNISNISIAVSASKVEALCDLKRDIEKNLERADTSLSVGLLHSYKYDKEKAEGYLKGHTELMPSGYASEPCSDSFDDKQILLCTHAKIRGRVDIDQYNSYQGKPRDLLIYDESLLVSDTRGIDMQNIESSIAFLKVYTKNEATNYIDNALKVFSEELTRQEESKSTDPKQITLPRLDADQLQAYKKILSKKHRGALDVSKALISFLNISQEPLRVISTAQGKGFISYDIVVPHELKNIVVLDASHNIRELVQLDKSIKKSELDFKVSHENTTVKHLKYFSGRHSMTNSFKSRKADRKVCLEVSEAVKSIPEEEGIIIFTFKTRDKKVNFRQILEDDLYKEGIDTDAVIDSNKPRFIWLTWGDETSHSKYSYCKHVILAGVIHRSALELGSAIVGQLDNLLAEVSNEQIQKVMLSECAHSVYQAYSRSASRIINYGKTSPATLWLIFNDESIKDYLDIVMPEAKWTQWNSKHILNQSKVDIVVEKIKMYLRELPEDVPKVSTQKIKKEAKLKSIPDSTFKRAIDLIQNATGWIKTGRSLIKV